MIGISIRKHAYDRHNVLPHARTSASDEENNPHCVIHCRGSWSVQSQQRIFSRSAHSMHGCDVPGYLLGPNHAMNVCYRIAFTIDALSASVDLVIRPLYGTK